MALNSNYNRNENEFGLTQIAKSIEQIHFSNQTQYPQLHSSPFRTTNSPAEVMEKFQIVTQDSGIVTRSTSPGQEDQDDLSNQGQVVYAWDQAAAGMWDPTHQTPQGMRPDTLTNGQGERLKTAIFPESHPDLSTVSSPSDNQTNMQRLIGSSHMVKQSITNLLQYKTDADITTLVIPELLKVLKGSNREVIEKAAFVIDALAKKEAPRHALLSTPLLLTALINAIGSNVNDEAAKLSASAMSSLSAKSAGVKLIHSCDGISFILSLLTSDMEHVIMFAVTCLHNMLVCQHDTNVYKEDFRSRGGVQHLVRLLNGHRERVLTIITDCLHSLAFNNEETKKVIYNYNGAALLARILAETTFEKLIWIVGRLMKVLAVSPDHKRAIVHAGGIQVISKHLNSSSPRIVQLYLRLLLTLSDVSRPEDSLEPILMTLLNLLQTNEDISLIIFVVGILSNMTCNNPLNKTALCNNNGIQILLCVVQDISNQRDININAPQVNEFIEGAICTLRHLTSKHEKADFAQNQFTGLKGLELVLKLFLTTTHWTLIKACLGLLRNLSTSSHNRVELRRLAVIPQIVELLRRSIEILSKMPDYSNSMPQDGVNMEDVLVLILSTIEVLSRDQINRNLIGKHDIIPVIIRLLFSDKRIVLEHTTCCLCELAKDPHNVQIMERSNCHDLLVKLLQTYQDETIEAYVTMTLQSIDQFRNYDPHRISNMDTVTSMLPPAPGNVTPVSCCCCCCCYSKINLISSEGN
eukprot:TRINITY_DN2690_c0_g3_i3.p1 TRINITY_DN2690_c0_g3~~TRINITY_DN2690_c0_g3_i3.p1  ORF type:complete len:760 (+),score=125.90 TRINITY_DN2690_c0_g3_i3:32-2281(+)